ncbi:hypothetical protein Rhal01_01940 [Rubritalea halochordaticola]|uniref:PepSY domain-containing protein n=1 Tax=Rubritalea halochordaticola TaxID=714537 RepID=A0ABP9UZ84_9BACT
MTKEEIIGLAGDFITSSGYKYGAFITMERLGDNWKVEFSYEGQTGRCQTADPPSIEILVKPDEKTAELLSLM